MTAGAAQSAASYMPAFGAFALPALAPVVVRLLAQGTEIHSAMAGMLALFGVALTFVARAGGRSLAEALHLRFRNALLLHRLSSARHSLAERTVAAEQAAAQLRTVMKALRGERDFADGLIETAPVIVLVVDEKGRILRFNSYLGRLTGQRLEQVKGHDWISALVPSDKQQQLRADLDLAASPVGPAARTGSIVGSKGEERQIEWYETPLRDNTVGSSAMLYIGQDVTERNRMQAELLHSQKMDAIGKLAGGIAHDFNNLLMGVRGCCMQAIESMDDQSPALPLLREVVGAVERRIAVTRQLLDFSRKRPFETRPIEVAPVVAGSEIMLQQLLGADIALEVHVADTTAAINADPAQIEQVLMSLASNARHAMPLGGTLTIAVERAASARADHALHPTMPDDWIFIRASDTGTGMDPQTQARVFEPFFTTKGPGEGTGLGLSMVYGLVKDLGGQIMLDSELGRGTTMTLCFPPASVTDRASREPSDALVTQLEISAETALLVDDEDLVRFTVKTYLEDLGYHVLQASHAHDAVEVSNQHAGQIQLLLTDMVLPGMDGRRLAQQVRAHHPALDVIYISAYPADILRQQGRLDANSAVLQKPFDRSTLAHTIRSVLQP